MDEGFLFFKLLTLSFAQYEETVTCYQRPQNPQGRVYRRTEALHAHVVNRFFSRVVMLFFHYLLVEQIENIPEKAGQTVAYFGNHFRWS